MNAPVGGAGHVHLVRVHRAAGDRPVDERIEVADVVDVGHVGVHAGSGLAVDARTSVVPGGHDVVDGLREDHREIVAGDAGVALVVEVGVAGHQGAGLAAAVQSDDQRHLGAARVRRGAGRVGEAIRKVRPGKFTPTSVAFTSASGPPEPDSVHVGGAVVVVVVVELPAVTGGAAGTSKHTGVSVQLATSHAAATVAKAPTANRARHLCRRRTADPVMSVQASTASPRVSIAPGNPNAEIPVTLRGNFVMESRVSIWL